MMTRLAVLLLLKLSLGAALTASGPASQPAWAEEAASELFGSAGLPAALPPEPVGYYARGCLAGGVAIAQDGPTWQAMRPSRNRRYGHPSMISLVERLSREAAARDGWPGLLIGDISQPRGGPMLYGHASHQVGLDADIWLTPMPKRRLTERQREKVEMVSMLKKDSLLVDPAKWTPAHARLIMRAASYSQVERIFVHPGIKKKLCDSWKGDRRHLGKVRPYYGHDAHFHIRMKCPRGADKCRAQARVPAGSGCDSSLAWWFTEEPWRRVDSKRPRAKPRPVLLADLPKNCRVVLRAPAGKADGSAQGSIVSAVAGGTVPVPVPRPRAGQ